ncbi:MAG: glycosyltransferase family 2 protein [Zoogloeaceae bacterium]|jgi:glycosyltransferase involved in cell wall biosynthesis|nr:glycosyltransferase family 2 protein [Zoogloeaceae bacterium]
MMENPARVADAQKNSAYRIAVVIPCYKVGERVLDVIQRVGDGCWRIYIVDDACPERVGDLVTARCTDPRVHVIRHQANLGVGGAVMTGYRRAIQDGAQIIVKIDGDGQLDPALMGAFVAPLIAGQADYVKGNRFFDLEGLKEMPGIRVFGNAILSFFSKLSSGYWDIFDPTNGYTAIRVEVAQKLPFGKISQRFFFESDMLFRLNLLRAVVIDIPMDAHYGEEVSNLSIMSSVGEFLIKHTRNLGKRIFYEYFLRDMSLASFELLFGIAAVLFGGLFGITHWLESLASGITTPAGTVMLSALPVMLGLQFLLAFIGYDIQAIPRRPMTQPLS